MNFKQYLQELYNIEVGQAIDAHEPTDKASMSVVNPNIVSEMNVHFMREFNEVILSPEIGLQKIRKVLHRYGDRKSTRLNSSHSQQSRMPSSA